MTTRSLHLIAQATETQWRLDASWPWAPGATVLLVGVLIAIVVWCYRHEVSPAGPGYRTLLATLRGASLALLLAMLSGLLWAGVETGRPRLAVLYDVSESMDRVDATLSDGSQTSRTAAAEQFLLAEDGLISRLQDKYEIDFYVADASWRRQTPERLENEQPTDDGSATRLGDAISAAIESAGPSLRGVIAVTDGQVTAGKPLAQTAGEARRVGAPLYLVGVGSEDRPAEALLANLRADEKAYIDDLVRFQAVLQTSGAAGKTVRVELRRRVAGSEAEGAVVETETVVVSQNDEPTPISVVDRPGKAGAYDYSLIATLVDADTNTPSTLTHRLTVTDDPIQILLAAGYPNYEFRFLKHLLERDESINVATVLQEADPRYVDSDLTALRRFPTREAELEEYDAIVLLDLDPTVLPRSVWDSLASFVGDTGGGLCLVAGPRGMPASLRTRSTFAALCPTRLDSASPGGWNEPAGVRVRPTSLAAEEPAFLLSDSPDDSQRVWRALPPLYWRADIGEPKPAASVLAVADGAVGEQPLVVSHFYGAGRVVLHATDSTYRWRFRSGDVFFARYWGQLLRTLARGKRSEDDADLRITSLRRRYDPGQPVVLSIRQTSQRAEQQTPQLIVRSEKGREFRPQLEPTSDGYRATLPALPAGRYRAGLAVADGSTADSESFEVVAPPGESARPEMNRKALEAAANRSLGKFYTLAEADRLADELPAAQATPLQTLPPIDLWNRWPMLALVVSCLSTEWILRKRKSML